MGTPNPNFARAHGEQILDEVKTALAAQCDCMMGGCPHDQIRDLVTRAFQPALDAFEKRLPTLPTDAAAIRFALAGALGELDGLRVSEAFFRNRLAQLESIFEHLKLVWMLAQEWADARARHNGVSMPLEAQKLAHAVNNAQCHAPPVLFTPEDRAALRALATWIDELGMMPDAARLDAFFRARTVIDRIAPHEVKAS